MFHINHKIRMWLEPSAVEPQAMQQIYNTAKLSVVDAVAIMPDCHYGIGATVGSVIACAHAVIPAAVGVDIGCGMAALQTNLTAPDLPTNLSAVRGAIEDAVPLGPSGHPHGLRIEGPGSAGLRKETATLFQDFGNLRCAAQLKGATTARVENQMGTLGGGNHFIELCLDEADRVWLMLHSGSRNVGKSIAEIHIAQARDIAQKRGEDLPGSDLAWFDDGTREFHAYIHDLHWAQAYARLNRLVMIGNVFHALTPHFPRLQVLQETVHCHHNYVARETHGGRDYLITRKGAVDASAGAAGIIPGSMGTKSYIVEGLGNPESFHSCSHGAGRRFSRNEAKRRYTVADLCQQTAGVECRKDAGVLDEIPAAYKDIDEVMEAQKDLVRIRHTLRAVLCVKG